MHLVDDAAMDTCTPEFDPISEKACQQFHPLRFHRTQCHDSLTRQILLMVKRTRVPKISWRMKFDRKTQTLSLTKHPYRLIVIFASLAV
jgi:hypothetical protein